MMTKIKMKPYLIIMAAVSASQPHVTHIVLYEKSECEVNGL